MRFQHGLARAFLRSLYAAELDMAAQTAVESVQRAFVSVRARELGEMAVREALADTSTTNVGTTPSFW
jgi:hypothetical protein